MSPPQKAGEIRAGELGRAQGVVGFSGQLVCLTLFVACVSNMPCGVYASVFFAGC